jgi:hypothetical protein
MMTSQQWSLYSRGGQKAVRGPHEALQVAFEALEPFCRLKEMMYFDVLLYG